MLELAGCNFCVSYARPEDLAIAHEIGQSVMLENGAFTFWRQGRPTNWVAFVAWVRPWLEYRTTWAVMPDVIDGDEDDNRLLSAWLFDYDRDVWSRCAPVWHMHESLDRLRYLCQSHDRVCIGSSGAYAELETPRWHHRMEAAMNAVCANGPPPTWLHMLRGMNLAGGPYPFASVDSTDVGRNHNRTQNGDIAGMAQRWDAIQCPARWSFQEQLAFELDSKYVECETCGGSGTVECGTMYPGWCDSDPCHGHCEVACNDCTGEGMVLA
jgi:hypothetical protein